MAAKILAVDDDRMMLRMLHDTLVPAGYEVLLAEDAFRGLDLLNSAPIDLLLLDLNMPQMDGLTMLSQVREQEHFLPVIIVTGDTTPEAVISAIRDQACDILPKPFTTEALLIAIQVALDRCPREVRIEVISGKPDWIEMRVPCDMFAIGPLERKLQHLKADLPPETRESITYAFREMLRNAIEHGGQNDPSRFVEVGYIRTPRMILYRIKDPGAGFDIDALEHAAIQNPTDDPIRHERYRQQHEMRPGGFGILIARNMVDEMLYNERHNEVVLIKYLDQHAA